MTWLGWLLHLRWNFECWRRGTHNIGPMLRVDGAGLVIDGWYCRICDKEWTDFSPKSVSILV